MTWLERRGGWLAVAVLLLGSVYLGLEQWLRGAELSTHLDLTLVSIAATATLGAGLAVRPRNSWRGEYFVLKQVAILATVALFLLPCALLVLYAAAAGVSAVFVALCYALVSLLVALLFALQVAMVACAAIGLLTLVFSDENKAEGFGLVVLAAGAAGLILLALWLLDVRHGDVIGWSSVNAARALYDKIASWLFLAHDLRARLASFRLGLLVSLLASSAIGLSTGVVLTALARLGRQRLMRQPGLRVYLPLGAAPVADEELVLPGSLLAPALLLCCVAWTLALVVTFHLAPRSA